MMFGVKPDIHYIKIFGDISYVYVPVSPERKEHDSNVKIGYVLGKT